MLSSRKYKQQLDLDTDLMCKTMRSQIRKLRIVIAVNHQWNMSSV